MSDADEGPVLPEDAQMLDALHRALGADPLPPGLVERAAGLVAFMDVDRELAALLEESPEPVGARGASPDRGLLHLETGDGLVSLEVDVADGRLDGQVLAGEVVEVALERTDGSSSTTAPDQLGRFSFDRGRPGPVRLRLQGGFVRSVTTDWFLP